MFFNVKNVQSNDITVELENNVRAVEFFKV